MVKVTVGEWLMLKAGRQAEMRSEARRRMRRAQTHNL
jgi:hypothetical protein